LSEHLFDGSLAWLTDVTWKGHADGRVETALRQKKFE